MTQQHNRSGEHQKIFSFALIFLVFSLLSFFAFLQHYNIISGAPTSGTVNFTILEGAGKEDTRAHTIRQQGTLLSLQLEVIPSKIIVHTAQYQPSIVRLRLLHRGTSPFNLVFSTKVKALQILEERVSLNPGGEKEVTLRVDTTTPGVFLGALRIEGVSVFKQLPVFIQVDQVDFHVQVAIPTALERVLPGQSISANIIIEPVYGENVTLVYRVHDAEEKIILEEQESLSSSQQKISFRKTLAFKEPLPLGDYFLTVTAEQLGKTAAGGDSFTVVESLEPLHEFPAQLYRQSPLIFFLIVLAILLLHLVMTWRKKA